MYKKEYNHKRREERERGRKHQLLRYRYLQADKSEFEGHSKPTFLHLPHRGYHSGKRLHAKSTLHHGIRPDSTEVKQIC